MAIKVDLPMTFLCMHASFLNWIILAFAFDWPVDVGTYFLMGIGGAVALALIQDRIAAAQK